MNFKKIGLKVLSVVLVLSMMVGVFAPVVSASFTFDEHTTSTDTTIDYVSLGASNTNGYGHVGYLPPEVTEDPLAASKANLNDYGYDRAPAAAYPAQIADALNKLTGKTVNLHQLAISSMRTEELRMLLDNEYYGDAYTEWRFTGGAKWFEKALPGGLDALREAYQNAIRDAEIITVDIGWNNFGVYAFNNIKTILADGNYWKAPKFEDVLTEDEQMNYESLKNIALNYLKSNLGMADADLQAKLDKMADVLAYAAIGACVHFDVVLEKIYELNPDATVVSINIQNLADGLVVDFEGTEMNLGELYGKLIEMTDLYRATESPYADKYLYADAGDVETFLDEIIAWDGDPTTLTGDMKDCFDMYDDSLYVRSIVEYLMVGQALSSVFKGFKDFGASYGIDVFEDDLKYTYQFGLTRTTDELLALDLSKLDLNNPAGADEDVELYGAALAKHLINLRHFNEDVEPDTDGIQLGKDAYNYVFEGLLATLEDQKDDVVDGLNDIFSGINSAVADMTYSNPGFNVDGYYKVLTGNAEAVVNDDTRADFVAKFYADHAENADAKFKEYLNDDAIISVAMGTPVVTDGLDSAAAGAAELIYAIEELVPTAKAQFEAKLQGIYTSYVNTLNHAYDIVATLVQYAASIDAIEINADTLNGFNAAADSMMAFVAGDFIGGATDKFFYELQVNGVVDHDTDPSTPAEDTRAPVPEYVLDENDFDPALRAILVLAVRYELGNSFFAHPNTKGNDQITAAVLEALMNGPTAKDYSDAKLTAAWNWLTEYAQENYPELYDALVMIADYIDSPEFETLANYLKTLYQKFDAATTPEEKTKLANATYELLRTLQHIATMYTSDKVDLDKIDYYVSLGDSTISGYGLSGYVDNMQNGLGQVVGSSAHVLLAQKIFGDEWKEKFANFCQGSLRADDLLLFLGGDVVLDDYYYAEIEPNLESSLEATQQKYIENVKNADLISVAIGGGNFLTFAGKYVNKKIAGTPYTLDWERIGIDMTGETAKQFKATLDSMVPLIGNEVLKDYIPEGVDIENAGDYIYALLEGMVYGYASYRYYYLQVLDRIQEINPDANVLILGIFNPVDEWSMSIDVDGKDVIIPIGAAVGTLLEIANIEPLVFAIQNKNAAYVDISEAETILESDNPGRDLVFSDYFNSSFQSNGKAVHASEAGHKYIAEQMFTAITTEYTNEEIIKEVLKAFDEYYKFIEGEFGDEIREAISLAIRDAYAYAYDKALDAGLIAEINTYLDATEDAIDVAKAWVLANGEYVRSEEFAAQILTSIADAEATIAELRELINEGDKLDAESYENLLALADALKTNALDVAALLAIAADDAGEYAYEKALELNAQIEKQIAILKAEAEAKIAALKAELENAVGEAKAAILAEIARIEAELNAKIAALEAAVNAKIAEIEAKIAELKADIVALNEAVVNTIEKTVATVEYIVANADEYFEAKLGEIYNEAIAAIKNAIAKLAPEAADYVYNWLYNNPEKVIAFFNEYGDDAFEFVKDNYETIIAVLGFIAVNYGEKMINYVMENSDTILPAIMGWFEIHGENTWELVKVYLTALGLKIDIIELDPAILADALNELRGFAKAILAELLAGSLDKIETVNVLKYLLSVIEGLEAKLDEALNNVDAAIKAEIKGQIGAIKAEIKGLINKIENALTTGDYTVTDDSYYAAITGSANGYVELLANALWLTEGQYTNMHWSEIDYAELMKADLITIGYDESDINGFAVNQMLGYVKAYIANVLKPNAANYLNDVLALVFDEGATTEEIRATFEAAMNEILEGDILKGKEYTELDWAGLVGEANVEYVEQIKQELYNELNKNNIPDTYTLTIDVVPYLVEYSGLKASFLYDTLGDLAYFTVEIPVAEVIVCGAESYVYSYASFSKAYAETIVTVSIYNPDATIIALGGYNPFKNIEFTVGDASIDLGAAYNMVSNLTSLHALLYAVAADVIYVEADDVVTIYDEAIAAGNAEADLISFILAYVSDPTVAQPGAAGYEYIKTQILNALNVTCEHVYDDMCTDAFCNRCGAEREDFEGHDIVIDEGYDATCTEEGLTEGKHCNTCGNVIVAQEVIPALGHDEVIDEVVLPTCTETGLTKGSHCGRCGEILDAQEVIPAHGHNEVIDEAVAPTCHETGLTEGSHCSACGQVFVAQEVVPALGHNEVIDAAVEATCTETGLTEGKHCDVCGEVIVAQEVVPAKGHTEVADAAVEATCTETGLTAGSHCSVCNTVIVAQETVAAKGHTEVVDAAKKATCTETGLTEGKHCSVCNTVIVAQQTVAALGHTEVIVAGKDATCTETGLTEGKYCSVCDTVLVAQETVAATGHKAGAAATCTEAQKCTVCNEELAEALGHKYENACDATCDICDETRTVADHVYGDWKVDTEATEDAEGKRSKTCSVCGNVVSETIPMLEKEGLSGGAVAAIVSVSVLAVGGAGVGVFFFIKKKKGI